MLSNPTLPRHRAIAEELRAAIRTGVYPLGSQLPSELALSRRYGVARGTVRQALAALKAEGAVLSRRGARGTVLAEPRAQSFSQLISFSLWARSLDEIPSGRVVSLAGHLSDEVDAQRLALTPGDPIFRLVRVRFLGPRAVLIERTTFPDTVGRLVAALDLERGSIYQELAQQGIEFANARHVVSAITADQEDAALLTIEVGVPLLRQLRRTISPAGEPLEWSDDRYRGDAVSFVVDNSSSASHAGYSIAPTANLGRV
jgi:GntR family transcriptional regulator